MGNDSKIEIKLPLIVNKNCLYKQHIRICRVSTQFEEFSNGFQIQMQHTQITVSNRMNAFCYIKWNVLWHQT